MLNRLLVLSGYDEVLLAHLGRARVNWLALANAWVWVGLVACGLSAALLVSECGLAWWVAGLTGLGSVVALGALQACCVTSINTSDLAKGPTPAQYKRSRWVLAFLLSLVLLVFTQPWVLLLADLTAKGAPSQARSLARGLSQEQARREFDERARDLAEVSEMLARLPSAAAESASAETPNQALFSGVKKANRKALVFGNDRYVHVSALEGAARDAQGMKQALERLGFEVNLIIDGTRRDMELALQSYVTALKPGDISLVHYSGHGFQYRNSNYLAPVDLLLASDGSPPAATALNVVIDAVKERKPLVSIIVIDACRENISGSSSEGLAAVETGANTYIAMAAKPGQLAVEVKGENRESNGLFTAAILRHIERPISLDDVFIAVRNDVAIASRKVGTEIQETWSSHNLNASIILGDQASQPGTARKVLESSQFEAVRLSDGSTICDVGDPRVGEDKDARLSRYSRCLHARLLQLRDEQALSKAKVELTEASDSGLDNEDGVRSILLDYRSFWSNPTRALVVTGLLLLLMGGGLWWRAALQSVHEAYAQTLFELQSAVVTEAIEAALGVAQGFPHAPAAEFLGKRLRRGLNVTPPVAPGGSLDDLFEHLSGRP